MITNPKQKIFFSDLDGTLLTKEKQISKATMDALRQWTDAGHKLVLSSGRAIDSIQKVKESMGLDFPGMYLVGCNGGEIYDCEKGEGVLRIPLTMEQTALVAKMAKDHGLHCQTYTDTHIISPADNEELRFYRRAVHTPFLISEDIVKPLEYPPCKCLLINLHSRKRLEDFRETLLSHVEGELNILFSNDRYLEIFPASSGKEIAVHKLCELLSIPLEDTLAAGDELNDIAMIQAAGVGIAMQNARDEVKAIANIITDTDNNHDGLAPVLLSHI